MARSAVDETSDSGAFLRTASTFRNFISQDPKSQFPAEFGRYHLYISYACPWASRCLAYLKIKGLDKAITFTVSEFHIKFPEVEPNFNTKSIFFLFVYAQSVKTKW
jgi:glutathionyl-hydroquinone reductase